MSSINRLFKHTFIYGLATVLPRLLTVLLTLLLTSYLPSKGAFGEVSIIFTWIILSNVLLTYGMETAFFRYHSQEQNKHKVLGTAIISLLITTLIFTIIAVLAIEYIADWTDKSTHYWRWVIPIIALDTLAVVPFAYMRARNQSMRYAVVKMINVVITVSLAALFLMALQDLPSLNQYLPSDKIELYFIALFIASAVTLLIVCQPYFDKWQFDKTLWEKMLQYGFPILIAGLAFAINESFDKVLLEWFLNTDNVKAQVGEYSAFYKVAVGMTLFATAFRLGVEPFFFSESQDKNAPETYAQITKMFVVLGSVILIVYIVFVDVIKLVIVDNERYKEGIEIVPLILMAYLFFGIYQSLSVWYKVTDMTRYGAYISVTGAIVTIVLNIVLIPIYGYVASAVTTCVAYGLMMMISYFMGRKKFPIPYEIKNLLTYLILSIILSMILFYVVRAELGVNSWSFYLVGITTAVVYCGWIWNREKEFIKSLIPKK